MIASEQTSASKREPGYYHVVYQGDEYIALWHDKKWFFCGDPGEIDEGIFDEIDERVIVRRPSLQIELIQERLNELDKANAASIRELRLLLSSERPSPQQQPEATPVKTWEDMVAWNEKMLDEIKSGQSDELSKRIRDLEEELHSETNEVTYYRDLYKKADEKANALAEAMRRINAITHENR